MTDPNPANSTPNPNPPPPAAIAPPAPDPAAPAAPAAAATPEAPPGVALISIDDFRRAKLVTAEILSAQPHPKADRLLVLQIKVGERTKQLVAGIRQFYAPETLIGRTIIVVDNLQPAKLRGVDSFGMLLAVRLPDGGLKLVTTDGGPAPSGLEVS